jgi:hypothetical protein
VLVLAVIGAIAIGSVLFVVLRKDKQPAVVPADAAQVVVTEIDAPVLDAPVELDAEVPHDAAPVDAAIAVKTPDAAPKKTTPAAVDRTTGDPLAWEWLDKADAAYRSGNFDVAKLHCNSVVDNSQTATATQRSIALVLRGTIFCKQQSIGQAQADLRAIPIASYKTALLTRCKAAGQPLQ